MCRITLKELREVKEILTSLLPKDKKDWKPRHIIFTEDLSFIVSQLERFMKENKFEFINEKFSGAFLYLYSTVLEIDRGEHPYLSLEEKDKIIKAKDFLGKLWDTIIEKRRQ